ncbi:MAG: TetR/AcrR family transcriptional regulator [Pseudanabaenales cyanobacterium]|nr:TetR/AcrR family transcriptional regulator [Pseudanabaenales cyanobacterium]
MAQLEIMARPREFDPQAALQTAIQVFWEKGYANTSVGEIVKRSGVAKYGIYGTFGNKEELFKQVLAQYARDRHQDIQRPIRQPGASLPEIRAFFAEAPKLMTQEGYLHGCLICNTGIELGLRDPEIRNFVNNFFGDIARVLQRCLVRAVEKGELETPKDIIGMASYLATEFRTALMLARSGYSRQDIEQHLEIALQVLQ